MFEAPKVLEGKVLDGGISPKSVYIVAIRIMDGEAKVEIYLRSCWACER